jgi:osmotically-inducible protein OsmY
MKTNEELREDVMDEIKWDPQLKDVATQIGVAVKDGVVTLSGTLDSYTKKLAAEKAAQRVSGVMVVASDVQIKLTPVGKLTDTDLAESIKNVLRWNSAVNHDLIEVKVDNGWVYLDGKADWEFERQSAQRSVENLIGVVGVSNNITIKPRAINVKELKNDIAKAFHRSASVDSSAIRVETSGNKVTLYGKVRSWAEKKEAENVAWFAPGVSDVDNQIDIDVSVYA